MPVPWKKAKGGSRISKLVADHLNSPKHGGSLVVETGFPTSLVDLFVKNRSRLKKASKKKRSSSALDHPKVQLKTNVSSSSTDLASEIDNLDHNMCFTSRVCDKIIDENDLISVESSGGGDDGIGVEKDVEIVRPKGVLVGVLMVFIVVVSALGTKKFAVGVTISAFLLFSIEFVLMNLCRFYKPYADSRMNLKSLIQRVLCFNLRIKQDKLDGDISGSIVKGRELSCVSGSSDLIKSHDSDTGYDEIEVAQPNSCTAEVQTLYKILNMSNYKTRREDEKMESKGIVEKEDANRFNGEGCVDMNTKKKGVVKKEEDFRNELSEVENRKSQRAKLKSKIKKLIPKKLRRSKKKDMDLSSEVCRSVVEDSTESQVEDKDEVELFEMGCDGALSSMSNESYCGKEGGDAICSSSGVSEGNVETAVTSEFEGTKKRGNLRYLVLFLIVLAGLVGGRIWALILTLSWCLMLKSGDTLTGFSKVPMFRFFVQMSS